jgi:hypothetical protein
MVSDGLVPSSRTLSRTLSQSCKRDVHDEGPHRDNDQSRQHDFPHESPAFHSRSSHYYGLVAGGMPNLANFSLHECVLAHKKQHEAHKNGRASIISANNQTSNFAICLGFCPGGYCEKDESNPCLVPLSHPYAFRSWDRWVFLREVVESKRLSSDLKKP